MTRKARLHETGDFHHVMSHGIDSLKLFESDEDCHSFLTLLEQYLTKYDCRCYGFALMGTHYHLILRPSGDNFSIMMRNLNNAFARYINKTRKRKGYVFRDRFKSIPTRDQNYLMQLLLYVHTNPLRANLVNSIDQLSQYPWTSHQAYLEQGSSSYQWLNTQYISSIFHSVQSGNYLDFLANYAKEDFNAWKVDDECNRVYTGIPECLNTGESDWIRDKIEKAAAEKKQQEHLQNQPDILQKILEQVGSVLNIGSTEVFIKSKRRIISNALKLFSFWAVRCAGFSGAFIGRFLNRSSSSILRAAYLGACHPVPLLL